MPCQAGTGEENVTFLFKFQNLKSSSCSPPTNCLPLASVSVREVSDSGFGEGGEKDATVGKGYCASTSDDAIMFLATASVYIDHRDAG